MFEVSFLQGAQPNNTSTLIAKKELYSYFYCKIEFTLSIHFKLPPKKWREHLRYFTFTDSIDFQYLLSIYSREFCLKCEDV